MIRFRQVSFILILFLIGCSSSNSPEIIVENAWSWPVEALQDDDGNSHSTGVVYLVIVNKGEAPDRLLAVQTDVAEVAEIHETRKDGDTMMMQRVEGAVDIAADSEVAFKPGGLHIMLIGLKQSLKPGEHFELALEFEQGGDVKVQSKVEQP